MPKQTEQRDPASQALVQLRSALNLTQQEFAGVLQTAVSTIGRYETYDPPRGEALLKLARIARDSKLAELRSTFKQIYKQECLAQLDTA